MRKAIALAALAALVVSSASALATTGRGTKTAPSKATASAAVAGLVRIDGDVASPRVLRTAELAILPQQTVTITMTSGGKAVTHTEQGPYLADVLNLTTPNFRACSRNDLLRWWILVTNVKGAAVVLGRGEIDPGFGNRPAILSIAEDGRFLTAQGPRLIVPGDGGDRRQLRNVSVVTAGRATPQLAVSGCET